MNRDRSQFATGSQKHRDPRFPPFAFTEHGAIQAANVLNSARAVEMGVYVVRAFEKKLSTHDEAIAAMLAAIRQLMHSPTPKRRGIGFTAKIESPAD